MSRWKIAILVVFILIVLLGLPALTVYLSRTITSGYVVDKKDIPAYQGETCTYGLVGSVPVCKTRTTTWIEEQRLLTISSCSLDDWRRTFSLCQTSTFNVTKSVYDNAQVGMFISINS